MFSLKAIIRSGQELLKVDTFQMNTLYNTYRKPTSTDIVIPKKSSTLMAYKEAAFRHLFNRSIQVPLNEENFRTEITTIIQIGLRNGYNIDDLQRIYNKIHVKNINNLIYPNIKQNKRYVVLDYHSTKTLPINKALQRYNITTAIRTKNKISNFLINCKHQPPKTEKSGVYQIKCDHCNKFYVGQSGRSLGERFDEHIKRKQSALGEHLKDTGHRCPYIT